MAPEIREGPSRQALRNDGIRRSGGLSRNNKPNCTEAAFRGLGGRPRIYPGDLHYKYFGLHRLRKNPDSGSLLSEHEFIRAVKAFK